MRNSLKLSAVLLIAGCASVPMIDVWQTNYPHRIEGTMDKQQIGKSILEGAEYAGWVAHDQGNDSIAASYQVRIHTVNVDIRYTEEAYRINYKSSTAMKMACTHSDKSNRRYRVSGKSNCPENQPPVAIHAAYKTWVDSLAASINRSLASRQ